jgi:hypothetical protein
VPVVAGATTTAPASGLAVTGENFAVPLAAGAALVLVGLFGHRLRRRSDR